MANSTTIIADLTSVQTTGPSAATTANAINPSGLSSTGGAGNMTGTTGTYASGTYYSGILDYKGSVALAIQKANELAKLVQQLIVLTDQASDSANQALLAKVLNDLQ